jgi:hypothetical protein
VRGDFEKNWFEAKGRLKSYYLPYHRLEDYLYDNSEIEYIGDKFSIAYKNEKLVITEISGSTYFLPNYNGIPSDNNFLNNMLAETHDIFAQLQEIEEENEN